ncbi:uncharacterized protein FTOL_04649 [Fusarium torulosum]|uniref:Uncharacterized protein n=1 Tax=Fusarium torulosum TaxID=33205 RepID=A0AAE8M7F0_9HYPO|nr:uncharacterized protein FTOL_04649 [Fusarium torulosum]
MMDPEPYHSIISSRTLSMATRAYYVQSKIFHIPDQFGFFSPGPPPRQEFEVERVIGLLVLLSIIGTMEVVALLVSLLTGNFEWEFVRVCLGFNCIPVEFFWALACYGPRRDPDYDWGSWEVRDK